MRILRKSQNIVNTKPAGAKFICTAGLFSMQSHFICEDKRMRAKKIVLLLLFVTISVAAMVREFQRDTANVVRRVNVLLDAS
jgi:hypothetical protein